MKEKTIKELLVEVLDRLDRIETAINSRNQVENYNIDSHHLAIENMRKIELEKNRLKEKRIDCQNKAFYSSFESIFQERLKEKYGDDYNNPTLKETCNYAIKEIFRRFTMELAYHELDFVFDNSKKASKFNFLQLLGNFDLLKKAYQASTVKNTDLKHEITKYKVEGFYKKICEALDIFLEVREVKGGYSDVQNLKKFF